MTMVIVMRMYMMVMSAQVIVAKGMVVAASVVSMRSFLGAIGHGAIQLSKYCAFHTLKLL